MLSAIFKTEKEKHPEIPVLREGRRRRPGFAVWLKALASNTTLLSCLGGAVGLGGLAAVSFAVSTAARPVASEEGSALRSGLAVELPAGIRIRRSADDASLSLLGEADNGYLRFPGEGPLRDAPNAKTSKATAKSEAEKLEDEAALDAIDRDLLAGVKKNELEGLAHALVREKAKKHFNGLRGSFVKKLSQSTSRLAAGAGFGGARELSTPRIYGGNGGFGITDFNLKNLTTPGSLGRGRGAGAAGAQRHKSSVAALSAGPRQDLNIASKQAERGYSSLAMGQLKLANRLSYDGSRAMTENSAKQLSDDAFDQQKSRGGGDGFTAGGSGASGGASAASVDPGEVVVAPGEGAPDLTANRSSKFGDDGLPETPRFTGENKTPYGGGMKKAKEEADKSQWLNFAGAALQTTGSILLSIGLASTPIGVELVVIGISLIAIGLILQLVGLMTKDKSKKRGDEISAQSGQPEQGRIVKEYADKTHAGEKYDPEPFRMPENSVRDDVKRQSLASPRGGGE